MKRRDVIILLGGAVAWPLAVHGQEPGPAYRIGFLRNGSPPRTFIDGLRQGLRELGYVESQNIRIDYGLAANADELPAAAVELVQGGSPGLTPQQTLRRAPSVRNQPLAAI